VIENVVVRKLVVGEIPIGVLAADTAHDSHIDLLQNAGHDFLMLDGEHGDFLAERITCVKLQALTAVAA